MCACQGGKTALDFATGRKHAAVAALLRAAAGAGAGAACLIRTRALVLSGRATARMSVDGTFMNPATWLCGRAPLWAFVQACELIRDWDGL